MRGVLLLPGQKPVELISRDHIQMGDCSFYFLLPSHTVEKQRQRSLKRTRMGYPSPLEQFEPRLNNPGHLTRPAQLTNPMQLPTPMALNDPMTMNDPMTLNDPMQLTNPMQLNNPVLMNNPAQLKEPIETLLVIPWSEVATGDDSSSEDKE